MEYNFDLFVKAYNYAMVKHNGQFREDGVPYITHPMTVAQMVGDNNYVKIVAILHDTLEDTNATMPELRDNFGEEIMNSVNLLSKKTTLPYEEYIQKIKVCGTKDEISVKIADLKHNLSTIDNIKDESRRNKLKNRYEKALTVLEEK